MQAGSFFAAYIWGTRVMRSREPPQTHEIGIALLFHHVRGLSRIITPAARFRVACNMLFLSLSSPAFLPQPRGTCVGAGAGAMRTPEYVMQYDDYRPRSGGWGSDNEYQREPGDTAPVDEARVKTLIAERSQLRRAMDYDGADAIRNQLGDMGVTVRDKDQTWRVGRGGGSSYGRFGGGRGGGGGGYGRGSRRRGYNDGSVGFFDEPRRSRGNGWYDDFGGADYGRGGYDGGYGDGGGYGGYDRGFGGGGGRRRDTYEREPGDTAEVDVARVEALLAERAQLRAARDFDGADAVRDELRDMDVTVHDREMRWFVGDLRDLTNGRGRGGRGRGGGYDDGGYGGGGYGRERTPRRERTGRSFDPADFGPLGHDYVAANDAAGELDEETVAKVNVMLAERLAAKVMRDFSRADGLRDELRGMGVNVDDRRKEWVYAPVEEIDFGPTGHDYTRSPDDAAELDEEAVSAADALLAQRLRAKMARRFGEADECLARLVDELGVEVDDKHKAWRADGAPFPSHVRIEGDGDEAALASGLDVEKVTSMLAERAEAKRQKEYETADALARSLRDDYAVVLDDKRGTWRAVEMVGGYYQVGPSLGDDELTERVRGMIARRTEHQKAKEYEEADALHAELTELGISLDTRNRSWRSARVDARGQRR